VVLLCKAWLFYVMLEGFLSRKMTSLNKLFGGVPQQGIY